MRKIIIVNMALILLAAIFALIGTFYAYAAAPEQTAVVESAIQRIPPASMTAGFFSAALSVGLSCFGAGMAVKSVGSAAMGAIAEKPELTGRALIFVGLAEGIAIYGLIVAIMILGKLV